MSHNNLPGTNVTFGGTRRFSRRFSAGLAAALLVCCGCYPQYDRPTVEQLFETSLQRSRVLENGGPERLAARYTKKHAGKKPATRPADTADGEPFNPYPGEATGPPVTDIFIQTDVAQAIQSIANQANVPVVIDQQVQGLISAAIDNEPFEAALRRLLMPLGCVYRQIGKVYYIGVPDPESALFPRIASRTDYRTRHLAPQELLELMAARFQKFMRVSEKHHLVIVEAPESIGREIINRLKRSDRPVPQVVLETIVVVFEPGSSYRFGLDLGQGIQIHGDRFINMALAGLDISAHFGPEEYDALNSFAFTSVFLRELAEAGYLTIRAAPRVMARDGEKASIRIGRETFFSTQPQAAELLIRQEIEEVESGIFLDMKPLIRGDRVVVNLEKVEVSEEIRIARSAGTENPFPVINRREVSTTVEVKNGHTIVIGGLVQRNVIDQRGRVPFLADTPLIGRLFHEVETEEFTREVAVFLSPRIVQERDDDDQQESP